MKIFVDVIAILHGSEEIVASHMAERDYMGTYRLKSSLRPDMYPELILVDSDGRHRVNAIDVRHETNEIVFQTMHETDACSGNAKRMAG